MSNMNIKCGSLIVSNAVFKNKQKNKKKKKTGGHIHATHADEKLIIIENKIKQNK